MTASTAGNGQHGGLLDIPALSEFFPLQILRRAVGPQTLAALSTGQKARQVMVADTHAHPHSTRVCGPETHAELPC